MLQKPKRVRKSRPKAAPVPPVDVAPVEDTPVETVPAPPPDGRVRVQCVVDSRPWHSGGFLNPNEVVEISAGDAEIMTGLGQVILIS